MLVRVGFQLCKFCDEKGNAILFVDMNFIHSGMGLGLGLSRSPFLGVNFAVTQSFADLNHHIDGVISQRLRHCRGLWCHYR